MPTHPTLDEWPLKKLNLFAMPSAFLIAILADSFWRSLLTAAGVGFVLANVIATLWIGRFREQLKEAKRVDPLAHLSAEIQGATDTSLHIRFMFMQSLAGALITAMWFTWRSG